MFIMYKHIETYWKSENQPKYTLYTHIHREKFDRSSYYHPFVVRHRASNVLFVYKWVNSGVIKMP